MVQLTEEEQAILKRAETIRRKMEEDIDKVPDDFGEPVKKKKKKPVEQPKETTKTNTGKKETVKKEVAKKEVTSKTPVKKETTKKGKNNTTKKKNKTKEWGRFIWKCIFVILALLFVLYLGARYISAKVNYQPYTTEYVRQSDVMDGNGVTNILILGTDERHSDDANRSDAMIVLSINENTQKIIMTSILRDSYVTIPGHGQNRINAAYQYGGAALAIQTVEENFKIAIDGFVKFDFYSFIDIVDAVGGVELDVDVGEVGYVNHYLNEINMLLNAPAGDGYLQAPGYLLLTGKQALGYARIRYIGTDFQRTQRQREVIEGVLKQTKTLNPIALYQFADTVLPQVVTNLDEHTMAMIIMKAPFYLGYTIEQNRIPMDGTWSNSIVNGQEVLSVDFHANIQGLQQMVYGE